MLHVGASPDDRPSTASKLAGVCIPLTDTSGGGRPREAGPRPLLRRPQHLRAAQHTLCNRALTSVQPDTQTRGDLRLFAAFTVNFTRSGAGRRVTAGCPRSDEVDLGGSQGTLLTPLPPAVTLTRPGMPRPQPHPPPLSHGPARTQSSRMPRPQPHPPSSAPPTTAHAGSRPALLLRPETHEQGDVPGGDRHRHRGA